MSDRVRVLRVIEYEGPRDWVEKTINQSLHGTFEIPGISGVIRAVTIGDFPSLLGGDEFVSWGARHPESKGWEGQEP